MTQLLVIIGVFVFFISVYGAVMVGGHLLAELEASDESPDLSTDEAWSSASRTPTIVGS